MHIAINSGTVPAPKSSNVTYFPFGAEVKRRLALLEEGHAKHIAGLQELAITLQGIRERVETMTVVTGPQGPQGPKGEKGERGEDGRVEQVIVNPFTLDGAWYRFWRRWLLGVF